MVSGKAMVAVYSSGLFLILYCTIVAAGSPLTSDDGITNNSTSFCRGRDGRDGRDGIQGPIGLAGESGPPGERGQQGARGQEGRVGPAGPPGPLGERGPQGVRGPAGRSGPPGQRGTLGGRGPQGRVGPPGQTGPKAGGVIYTRWGHNTCPGVAGTKLLYSGRVAGAFYSHSGGGANLLCLPGDPEYTLRYRSGVASQWISRLYGTEYEIPIAGTRDHGVPCAVCYSTTRVAVVMIPAKTSCPTNWTREYYGYIMSEATIYGGRHRNQYVCVDKNQVSVPGTSSNIDGNVLYHVEVACHGIQCPPYDPQKELNCVVCTN